MQVIFNYELNGQKYMCYLKNNNILFGKSINNKTHTNLNEEELKQMISIYMFFLNNQKNSQKIKNFKVLDTSFAVYYNSSNDLFTFKQLDNLDNKSILPILNKVFNTRDNSMYSHNKGIGNFIKITLLVGVTTMTINVSAFLSDNALPVTFKDYDDFEAGYKVSSVFREEIETYNNTEYRWDDIKSIIDNNPNLNDAEKEFLYGFRFQIEDNIEYIDIGIVKRNLSEIKFVYKSYDEIKEEKKKEKKKNNITLKGTYDIMGSSRNTITFYGTPLYPAKDFDSISKPAAAHEVGHALTRYSLGYSYPGFLGDLKDSQYYYEGKRFDKLAEGINEIFSREYLNTSFFGERSNGYNYLMPAIYVLCEILDPEVLRCYKYNCNLYYVTNALHRLGIPLEDIHSFYNLINFYVESLGDKEEEKNKLAIISAKKAYSYLNEFYYIKYGINIIDNLALSAAFYQSCFVDDNYNSNLENELSAYDFTYYPKIYFNRKLKEENSIPYIMGINEFGHFTEVKLDGSYKDEIVK